MWHQSFRRYDYETLERITRRGRTWDGGDRGGKLCNETYAFNRGECIALQHFDTDIALFYPDWVVLNAGGWQTPTTVERLRSMTPLRIGKLSEHKYRNYLAHGNEYRVFAAGAPDFGLDYETGVKVAYDGRWLPSDEEERTTRLCLPRKGARRQARQCVNSLRKLLRPHLTMLQGKAPLVQPSRKVDNAFGHWGNQNASGMSMEHILRQYADIGLDKEDIDFTVDCLLWLMYRTSMDVNEALNQYFVPQSLLQYEFEERVVHHDEVHALLDVRGPEWAD